MDYSALKTLLNSDPANANKTDIDAAAWCNEKVHQKVGRLEISSIASRWLNSGVWDALLTAAADNTHAAHQLARGVVTVTHEARTFGLENFDFSLPRPNQLLAGLRDAGFIDQVEVDAIVGLATVTLSRAENVGITEKIRTPHIVKARAL